MNPSVDVGTPSPPDPGLSTPQAPADRAPRDGDPATPNRRGLTLEAVAIAAIAVFGFRAGAKGISDNSTFVHLRTGIEMVRHWSIPRHDPYSFTAPGHAWVVQSWLASFVYGAAWSLGGLHAVVMIQGVLMASVAGLTALLARAGTMLRTATAGVICVGAGAYFWSPRPLLFGLIGLALVILCVERRWNPLWLLPIGWVWVNTHGSFPLGVAWIAARLVGEMIDARGRVRWMERQALVFVIAILAGAVNPLGPRLLAFPFTTATSKHNVLKGVVEWKSPDWQSTEMMVALGFFALALLVLFARQMPWKDVLAVVGFFVLGLFALRNLAALAIVLAPAVGRALHKHPDTRLPALHELYRRARWRVHGAFVLLIVAMVGIFALLERQSRPLDLRSYPTAAATYLIDHNLLDRTHRIAAQDVVGCYLVLLRGTKGQVFMDDRFDMYPLPVSQAYDALLHGSIDAPKVLDDWKVDVVLWSRQQALPNILDRAGGWRTVYQDKDWDVQQRTTPL